MPHQVRVDATPVRHELIAIVAIPYEKLGYQTLGLIEPRGMPWGMPEGMPEGPKANGFPWRPSF